jgi:spermidine synthase
MYQGAEFATAVRNMSGVFDVVEPYLGFVPTYPGVLWSFTTGTTGEPVSSTPPDVVRERLARRHITTRFYSPEVHRGAFALPAFVADLAKDAVAATATIPRG